MDPDPHEALELDLEPQSSVYEKRKISPILRNADLSSSRLDPDPYADQRFNPYHYLRLELDPDFKGQNFDSDSY